MKLSTLIEELKTILAEHGDMPVRFREHGPDAWYPNTTDHPRVITWTNQNGRSGKEMVL